MSSEPPPATPSPGSERRGGMQYFPVVLFILLFLLLFIGGGSALLYLVFSEYSGVRNIWLLVCGAPVLLVILAIFTMVTLYTRYGKPVGQIVHAIDAIAEGDLSARVPEDNSPQFQRIIKRFNKMVDELERAEQQRRNLTADIAHELRTPLHIIQGNLEGIIDGVYEPTDEHINNTLDEMKLLSRLVSDLQTLSLAETRQLSLHPTTFLLADLMDDLTASFSSQAASLGIALQASLPDQNQELSADYDRLNQALSNLISNALQHTPAGGAVAIQAGSIGGAAGRRLRITVGDTGSGIPAEDLPFIFDRFWRGDKSRTGRAHSGLGLAITKQLVYAHHGTIEVQSEAGKGTTFTIEIPQ